MQTCLDNLLRFLPFNEREQDWSLTGLALFLLKPPCIAGNLNLTQNSQKAQNWRDAAPSLPPGDWFSDHESRG